MPVESLKCPNCGAPLDVISEVMRCPYCNTNITFQSGKGSFKADAPAGMPAGAPAAADPAVTQLVDRIVSLCRAGKKIEAIKLFRTRTGDGLADAKAAVEDLERGRTSPVVMEKLRRGTGE